MKSLMLDLYSEGMLIQRLLNDYIYLKTKRIIQKELNIQSIINRDPKAIVSLGNSITVWVYQMVFSYLKNEQDAEEVIQDTFLAALSGIENFKNDASLKTWVYRIAINKSKDFIKYNKRKKRDGNLISLHHFENQDGREIEVTNFEHPGNQLESQEKIDIIFKGISKLPEKQKEVLTLIKLEHLSIQEVADTLDSSYKSIESLLSRARQNLKLFLETEGFELYKKQLK